MRLVLLNGGIISVQIPDDGSMDEVYEDFHRAWGRNYWYVGNWCNVVAEYEGFQLSEINMNLVVGVV